MKQEHKNSNFDEKLRKKFEHAEITPPPFKGLMSGVQSEVDSAWQNNFIEPVLTWKSFFIYGIGLSLLIPLLFLKSDDIQNLNHLSSNNQELIQETLLVEKSKAKNLEKDSTLPKNSVSINDKLDNSSPLLKSTTEEKIAHSYKQTSLSKVIPKKNHKISSSGSLKNTTKQKDANHGLYSLQAFSASVLPNTNLLLMSINGLTLPENNSEEKSKKTIGETYVGILGKIYSPWVFNQNTYGGFDGYEFAYSVNIEQKASFRVGYNSNKRLGVEIGFVPTSIQGQHYEDHIQGRTQRREVELKYWQIPVFLKYRTKPSSHRLTPAAFNIEAGLVYNRLRTAKEFINDLPAKNITERFRPHIWQASLGISTDFYLNDRIFTTVGLRSYISNDINAAGWGVNDSYRKSHSIILEANLGVSYRIFK